MNEPTFTAEYRQLPEFFYSDLHDGGFDNAALLELNTELAAHLGLKEDWLRSADGLAVLSGARAMGRKPPLAMAYAGYQFGHWSGLLGDGRARLVGDVTALDDCKYELHLKGAGMTPYSRDGDGKATLGSVLREYLVSEAMAALGVSSTRSLAIITTGESIMRTGEQPGAILCRTAKSHIRVGTFQWAARAGTPSDIRALADFAIDRLFPEIETTGSARYTQFLDAVIERQAQLIAQWMGLGFIHGVMNTDNMCVSGETIDYGPCAFMDDFHAAKVFSSIDRHGRYAWNRQPEIGQWNLSVFAETLLPLLGENEAESSPVAQAALSQFPRKFEDAFHTIMAAKLGLRLTQEIPEFIAQTIQTMHNASVDFTLFFSNLNAMAARDSSSPLRALFKNSEVGEDWLAEWQQASGFKGGLSDAQLRAMRAVNPVNIPRNHRIEQAITDANAGKLETFHALLAAVRDPYSDRSEYLAFTAPPRADEVVHQTFCGT